MIHEIQLMHRHIDIGRSNLSIFQKLDLSIFLFLFVCYKSIFVQKRQHLSISMWHVTTASGKDLLYSKNTQFKSVSCIIAINGFEFRILTKFYISNHFEIEIHSTRNIVLDPFDSWISFYKQICENMFSQFCNRDVSCTSNILRGKMTTFFI